MNDLTKGPISRAIIKMAGFMLVSMLFQTLYFLVDLYFVGKLGKDAVAAVSLSGNLMFIVLAATQMLGVGTTALISHATGRKDREAALVVFNQSQVLSLLVGVLFMVVMTALRGGYARGLAAEPITAGLADDYLSWYIPASALQFAMVASSAALRGTGNFRPGMLIQSATVIVNIVLAPVLIFGWGTGHAFGVSGAAMATFVAVAGGVLALGIYVLRQDGYLAFAPRTWRPQLKLWWRMLSIGLPAGAEFALTAVYMAIVYSLSRRFGAAAQAGFGIGLRVVQAGFLPVVALGFAASPVAGQNFGARLGDRVRETFRWGLKAAVTLMLLWSLLCHLAPGALVRVFSKDAQVVAIGGEYLSIISWNFVASGIIFVASSMFQAMGNTLPSLASSAVRVLLLAIPAFALARLPGFQLRWLWYLSVVSVNVQVVLSLLLLRREFRRRLAFAPVAAAASAAG
jgi:putative MATE family efflux protein